MTDDMTEPSSPRRATDEAYAWAVVESGAIKVRTIMDTRRAAIVNWLVTERHRIFDNETPDDLIERWWFEHKGAAEVEQVCVGLALPSTHDEATDAQTSNATRIERVGDVSERPDVDMRSDAGVLADRRSALNSTHDEAIRAEEREEVKRAREEIHGFTATISPNGELICGFCEGPIPRFSPASNAKHKEGCPLLVIDTALARASSPRPVPAEAPAPVRATGEIARLIERLERRADYVSERVQTAGGGRGTRADLEEDRDLHRQAARALRAFPPSQPPEGGLGDALERAGVATLHGRTVVAPAPVRATEGLIEEKNAAYLERNRVVAALARLFPSGLARTAIEGWEPEWHGCVYIDLPTGQVSWHYHDSHAFLFDGLPAYAGTWDGHNTPEKYRRLAALLPPGTVAPEGWRPISTAPKDGTHVLALWPSKRRQAAFDTYWDSDQSQGDKPGWHAPGWGYLLDGYEPTGWMPHPAAAPSPPASETA